MTSKNAVGLVAFTGCLALSGARSAGADNTSCENAILVVPDGSAHTGTINVGGERRWFKFINKADRSYSIEIENLSAPDVSTVANMGDAHAGSCAAVQFGGTIPRFFAEPATKDAAFAGGDREVIQPLRACPATSSSAFRRMSAESSAFVSRRRRSTVPPGAPGSAPSPTGPSRTRSTSNSLARSSSSTRRAASF